MMEERSFMRTGYALLVGILIHIVVAFPGPVPADAEDGEYDGLIEPYMVIKVGSAVPGLLDSVTADRGDMVKKGQVLATLQSGVEEATMGLARFRSEMEAAINAKRAELEFAERNRKRTKDLYDQKALPYHEWDEAETRRILAELQLAEALENKRLAELEFRRTTEVVKRRTILSPVNGVVVERYLSPGEYVEDQPILELAQIDPLNVEVILRVDVLGSVSLGMRATVKPEESVGGTYTAKVTVVDRVVDAASGTFGVRLEIPNPDYRLPPGLKCKVIFLNR